MNILFTGFKGYNNPTSTIINKIIDKGINDTLLFNNSYKQLDKINTEEYDLILMLGLRNNLRKNIRIEVNLLLDTELSTTHISYDKLRKYFLDNDIGCIVNEKPTNYLCNYTYHKVLKCNKNTIFIHLPSLKYINDLEKLIKLISNINHTTCI